MKNLFHLGFMNPFALYDERATSFVLQLFILFRLLVWKAIDISLDGKQVDKKAERDRESKCIWGAIRRSKNLFISSRHLISDFVERVLAG